MLKRWLRERSRSKALRTLGLTGTAPDPRLDGPVEQAARAFAAPFAMVSLMHPHDQWVTAGVGIGPTCLPRHAGFCTHVLDRADILEVGDTLRDPRFRDLPTVAGEPGIRYYLGAPLRVADGTDIGVLCVLDVRPRGPASADQRAYLLSLARQVTLVLERRLIGSGAIAA